MTIDYDAMVSVDELHCPTCGAPMDLDTLAPVEATPPTYTDSVVPHDLRRSDLRPAIACEDGHRWTVRAAGFRTDEVERCLLGEYLG